MCLFRSCLGSRHPPDPNFLSMDFDWDALDCAEAAAGQAVTPRKRPRSSSRPPTSTEKRPKPAAEEKPCAVAQRLPALQKSLPLIGGLELNIGKASVDPDKVQRLDRSWLVAHKPEDGQIDIGCVACMGAHKMNPGRPATPFSKLHAIMPDSLHVGNLRRHPARQAHYQNVLQFLGVKLSTHNVDVSKAPSSKEFAQVWDETCKGLALHSGIPGIGDREKVEYMQDCIYEGMLKQDRSFLEGAACTLIMRDERCARLLVRFRSVNHAMQRRSGILGQRKGFGTGAINIAKATEDIVDTFCVVGGGRQMQRRRSKTTTPECFPILARHLKSTVEATIVDAASDEVIATKMLATGSAEEMHKVFQNHRLMVRDKAHGSRRILYRPQRADPYLNSVVDFTIWNKSSITQIIQHSDEISRQFASFVKTCEHEIQGEVRSSVGPICGS